MLLCRVMNSSAAQPGDPPSPSSGRHIATISHDGRFWDVYLEFDDNPRRPETCRGVLAFSPADGESDEEPVRTAPIIIEPSYEEAIRKARSFDERDLEGLLRSAGS